MTRRFAYLAALLVLATALIPASADADNGYFTVQACGDTPNRSWHAVTTHGGMAAYPGPPSCDGGLVARHAAQPDGYTVPTGAAARWIFDAPPGTAVAGVTL